METEQTENKRVPATIGERGVQLADVSSLWKFSEIIEKSGLAPKGITTVPAIFTAIQMGLEVGLTPMAALQNIAVINGRPTIWGDAMLAVCRATGQLEQFEEWYEVGGKRVDRVPLEFTDTTAAVCQVKRRNYPAAIGSFSVREAKLAGLWGKQGPWTQYPGRMLRYRSRAFTLRDQFGDALKGMRMAEEAIDAGNAIDVETVQSSNTINLTEPAKPEPQQTHPNDAPAESRPTSTGETTCASSTPQSKLSAFVESIECTLDDFNAFAVDQGHMDREADSWDSVPVDVATRMMRAQKGLTVGLNAAKARREGK
jgi:hypothetical protein